MTQEMEQRNRWQCRSRSRSQRRSQGRWRSRFSALPGVAFLACALAAACADSGDHLVIVNASTALPATGLTGLVLRVGSLERTFDLVKAGGLGPAGLRRGVYVPASLSGDVSVSARARSAGPCEYASATEKKVRLPGAGKAVEVAITLDPGNACEAAGVDGGRPAGPSPGADGGPARDGAVAADAESDSPRTTVPDGGADRATPGTPDGSRLSDSATDPRDGGPDAVGAVDAAPQNPAPDTAPPPRGPVDLMTCKALATYDNTGCDARNANNSPARGVAYAPDGTRVFVGLWEGGARAYAAGPGRLTDGPPGLSAGRLETLRFSPDGKRLFGLENFGTFRAFDPAVGGTDVFVVDLKLDSLEDPSFPEPMADADLFFSYVGNTTIGRIWSISKKQVVRTLTLPRVGDGSVARPTGASQWMVVRDYDTTDPQKFFLLNVAATNPGAPVPFTLSGGEGVLISPDATFAVIGGYGRMSIVDLASKAIPTLRPTPLWSGASTEVASPKQFSPDGRLLLVQVAGGGRTTLHLYEVPSGRRTGTLPLTYGTFRADFSGDGSGLVVSELNCGRFWHCR